MGAKQYPMRPQAFLSGFVLSALTGTAVPAAAQNLVLNPSFEHYAKCPEHLGNFHTDVAHWTSPTAGSTDYFNACSTAMGTPENFNGEQQAVFGQGYAGIYLYAPDDYREYVQAELVRPLTGGETYLLSFHISLAERSDFAVRDIGICISGKQLDFAVKRELSRTLLYKDTGNTYTFLEAAHPGFYEETGDWIPVRLQFTARGGERFLTIGNFRDNAQTRRTKTRRNAKQGAYYYLDMVSLTGEAALPDVAVIQNPHPEGISDTLALNTRHVFKNVLFDFDEFQILETARSELFRLFNFLQADQALHIAVHGHTDNIGSDAYNRLLSERRCQAVAKYLIGLGLSSERISWVGHGRRQPVADNTDGEGRKLNRRVEFLITRNSAEH